MGVDVDETPLPGEAPAALAARLALAKALAGRERSGGSMPVLGADTVVAIGTQLFGKPLDRDDAVRMLTSLGGREHQVLTAVALAPAGEGRPRQALAASTVRMRPISPAEALAYWESGEPAGKAGGYAIQGLGAVFIAQLAGSYSGVMGLPLYETAGLLQSLRSTT
jgi:septum formation protein